MGIVMDEIKYYPSYVLSGHTRTQEEKKKSTSGCNCSLLPLREKVLKERMRGSKYFTHKNKNP
jgi:hypothetical protein